MCATIFVCFTEQVLNFAHHFCDIVVLSCYDQLNALSLKDIEIQTIVHNVGKDEREREREYTC